MWPRSASLKNIARLTPISAANRSASTAKGSVPSGYSITEGLSASIAAGSFDDFTVQLATRSTGTFAGDITFTNGDADEGSFNFRVTGTITPPSSGFSAKYDFGTATSPVASGYTRVTNTTAFSAATGFGWQSGT